MEGDQSLLLLTVYQTVLPDTLGKGRQATASPPNPDLAGQIIKGTDNIYTASWQHTLGSYENKNQISLSIQKSCEVWHQGYRRKEHLLTAELHLGRTNLEISLTVGSVLCFCEQNHTLLENTHLVQTGFKSSCAMHWLCHQQVTSLS